MQTKLTLRLDADLIERAKAWARSRDVSLSEAVAEFFSQLPSREDDRGGTDDLDLSKLSPWTRRLVGAAAGPGTPPTDEEVKRDYIDYLEKKYR